MNELVLLDNDVVLKISCYDLVSNFQEVITTGTRKLAALGLASFVLTKRLKKSKTLNDREGAMASLAAFLGHIDLLEPEYPEVALAAQYESYAQSIGAALDSGESLLLAMLISRSAELLLTGDKRAVIAVHQISLGFGLNGEADRRVACLEQAIRCLLTHLDTDSVANSICKEPSVDMALSICFRCVSKDYDTTAILDGLSSYIEELRRSSGDILLSGEVDQSRKKTA